MRTSLLAPYAAYLRVYEPLAAFPEPERSHWYDYAAGGELPSAQDEVRSSLAGLTAVPPRVVPERESREAFVAVADGVTHICPWTTQLRVRLALEEAVRLLPDPALEAALPAVLREQLQGDFERWRDKNPDARPWIQQAAWHVPVRWFVLFDGSERSYQPGGGGVPPALSYRTSMTRARQRTARGLRVLRDAMEDDGLLSAGLEQVGRWLEEFHPRSLVELDYGGLVHALPPERLAEDVSAADVTEGLAALREGDGAAAGVAYRRLHERWRGVQQLQFAN
ncbi:hypothetical protein BIV57_04525 [Mangrovactinospora gilvigrisea]|uniref:DUF8083 domain-containing protein n=1 Tax=Mangrovactinospora gilvigrisea TaxID=1428644 RepID=A0A1J7CAV5_9ACTN|nr:hypothetical protein [Mangrovactinospora gilvigrisea]OIV38660.1 hypothetical protein BIV57_04525 [Mangrovactinospora gilvigrisea]